MCAQCGTTTPRRADNKFISCGRCVAVRYGTRDVDCEDAAVKARVETALERIDVAIADSSFSRALPSVSGVSAGADIIEVFGWLGNVTSSYDLEVSSLPP